MSIAAYSLWVFSLTGHLSCKTFTSPYSLLPTSTTWLATSLPYGPTAPCWTRLHLADLGLYLNWSCSTWTVAKMKWTLMLSTIPRTSLVSFRTCSRALRPPCPRRPKRITLMAFLSTLGNLATVKQDIFTITTLASKLRFGIDAESKLYLNS